ncbi:MAG TPA: NADH-quinone oxidoreductase subunit N, partial [Myxococcaceae bacterium]|nr:NADH-quinone oxidoreductase subunit N [Myxococcaceae bacterium]
VGFNGSFVLDDFARFLKMLALLGSAAAILLSLDYAERERQYRFETSVLILLSTLGMLMLISAADLIALYLGFELMSLALYVMAAIDRDDARSSEAGLKYFVLGALSSGMLLYGCSLIYGFTGTVSFAGIAKAAQHGGIGLTFGLVFLFVGFCFKVSAVPFHMWTPDVYEGAPTPVTAMMSAAVKAAAFAAMVRVFLVLGHGIPGDVLLIGFSTLAFLTMIGGNLLALPQRNVKRMLAYSSISHAGYLLVGVASLFVRTGTTRGGFLGVTALTAGATPDTASALRGILFYLLAYTVTTVGAFGVLGALERKEDEVRGFAWDLDRLAGLAQRKPGWALAMAVFMLSLGGIPPMAGFMGKLLIFRAAVDAGLVGLVIVGVLTSAVGAYYYLRVVVYMYMRPAPDAGALPERSFATELALVLSTVAVVVLGIVPGVTSAWLSRGGSLFLGR